ncbi:hypothetical protein GCM10025734_52950 [Kitasatospora paranensis]
MPGAEVQQVVRGGAGEGVDGLAGVADHAQARAAGRPLVEQPLLERRDVLVLVDGEVPVLGADPVGDLRAVLQDGGGEQQHVLEVDHPAFALGLLVGGVDPGDLGRVPRRVAAALEDGRRVVVGDDLGDLGPLDLAGEVAQFGALDAQPAAGGGLGDELDLALQQARHLAADGARPEVLELAQGGGVEGPGLHALGAELAEPAAHLAGRARGEGHGEHLLRLVDAAADAVGDPVGDGPGLAGAGAGEHADRAVQGGGDGALFGVEPGEHGVGADGGAVVRVVRVVRAGHAQELFLHGYHPLSPTGGADRTDILAPVTDSAGRAVHRRVHPVRWSPREGACGLPHAPPRARNDGCTPRVGMLDRTPPVSKEYAAMSGTVTMYSTTWCGYCNRLKSQLDREGIAYSEINIEEDAASADYVESVNNGNQTVPTVVVVSAEGQQSVLTNPSLRQVQAALV